MTTRTDTLIVEIPDARHFDLAEEEAVEQARSYFADAPFELVESIAQPYGETTRFDDIERRWVPERDRDGWYVLFTFRTMKAEVPE